MYEFIALMPDFKWDPYPTLAAVSKSFSEIPEIAQWVKDRPESKY